MSLSGWGWCPSTARVVMGLCLALATPALLLARSAHAHGLGAHLAGGVGDSFHQQIGVTWDTSVAADRTFNYRLSVARETFDLDRDGEKEHLSGMLVENTFGLQLTAGKRVRTWLGPQVATGFYGDLGVGLGLGVGANWHVGEAVSLGLSSGVRQMVYSGLFRSDESETVGYLRLDLLWRTPGDRPPR